MTNNGLVSLSVIPKETVYAFLFSENRNTREQASNLSRLPSSQRAPTTKPASVPSSSHAQNSQEPLGKNCRFSKAEILMWTR